MGKKRKPEKELWKKDFAEAGGKAILEGKNTEVTVNAKAVILATGGYSNNMRLVAKLTPEYSGVIPRDNPGATGDGITFAESAGGYLWATDAGCQFFCVDTKRLYDLPTLSTFASSIMVNLSGDRFVNESLPFTIPARALRSQKGGKGWFVFDDTARAMHKPIEHYFEMGIVTEADSIKELADKISAPNLPAAVERYNTMSKAGKDEDFGRSINLRGITGEHFYAVGAWPAIDEVRTTIPPVVMARGFFFLHIRFRSSYPTQAQQLYNTNKLLNNKARA